jgi:hypothetical protein
MRKFDLLNEIVDLYALENHLRFARAIELRMRATVCLTDGALNDSCPRPGALAFSRSSSDSVRDTGEIALLMSCAMPLAIAQRAQRSCA